MPFLARLFLPIALALAMLDVAAAPAPDRYTAEVPVTGADVAQRDEAIARAFREVVAKVSGDPRSAAKARAVRDPAELVAQYQYTVTPGGGRALRVTFDRAAIDELLSDAPAAAPAPVPAAAVATAPGERFRVQVRGIDSLARFARVMRLFQGAAGADGVALRAARGDHVLFELSGRVGPDQIDRIAREGGLEPEAAPVGAAGAPGAAGQASSSFEGTRLRYRVMQ